MHTRKLRVWPPVHLNCSCACCDAHNTHHSIHRELTAALFTAAAGPESLAPAVNSLPQRAFVDTI